MQNAPSPLSLAKAFVVLLVLLLLLSIGMVAPYLLAVFLGWILATVLRPLYAFLVRKRWKPTWAATLATAVATFTIILPIVGFGAATVSKLIRVVAPYANDGLDADHWAAQIAELPFATSIFHGPEEIRAFIEENSKAAIGFLVNGLTGLVAAAPEFALQLALALLGIFFILRDGGRFCAWMEPRIPLPNDTKAHLARTLNATAYSSFVSMFLASLAQSLVVLVGFLVLKVPMAGLAFGVAFVAAWFPIFGVSPVWLAAMVYLFAVDRTGAAIGMIAFGVAAGLADNGVRPWVMKGRDNIHPFITLVAIFGAIRFFGIIGVLVGPVLAGTLIEVLRIWPELAKTLGLARERVVLTDGEQG
jgi:predicted PurR-regulated permease PerM